MFTFVLSILFVIIFVSVCLLFQLSVGKNKKNRKNISDKEAKVDNKSLWIGFYFYLFLSVLSLATFSPKWPDTVPAIKDLMVFVEQ
jgi:hypothetical protein